MIIDSLVKSFEEMHSSIYYEWRVISKKAGKDIVGEEYEKHRTGLYESLGYRVGKIDKSTYNFSYNPDLVILNRDGTPYLMEESKGHYVDKPFLVRAISNFAVVIKKCIKNNIDVPWFVLSSPTKMGNFDEIYDVYVDVLGEDIKQYFKEKFVYHPWCDHGRVSRKKYYASKTNSFQLDKALIEKEYDFLMELKEEYLK